MTIEVSGKQMEAYFIDFEEVELAPDTNGPFEGFRRFAPTGFAHVILVDGSRQTVRTKDIKVIG